MRSNIAPLIIFFATFFALPQMYAQTEELDKANKYFEMHAFDQAIKLYEQALAAAPADYESAARLAECYRQTGRFDKAGLWYSKAVENPNIKPEDVFYYARVLKTLGRYDDAKARFLEFAASEATVGNHYATSCDYAKNNKAGNSDFNVRPVNNINAPGSEFAPAFYKDKLIFSSFKKVSNQEGEIFHQMFISNVEGLQVGAARPLRTDFQVEYNEGAPSYAASEKQVAFARNNNNFTDGVIPLNGSGVKFNIYLAKAIDQANWEEVNPFPYNGGGKYSNAHPFLTPDGQLLYFASDVPGGYGGYDIYVAKRDGNDWSEPVNLGGNINSAGDEVSPFVLGTTLFFSSNWHSGYGGLDVFKSTQKDGTWSLPKNMGLGINSSYNDYEFIYKPSKKLGFFTSNRALGGKGKDDIYQAVQGGYVATPPTPSAETTEPVGTTTNPTPTTSPTTTPTPSSTTTPTMPPVIRAEKMVMTVVDENTRRPIEDVRVDFSRCNGPFYTTDEVGKTTIKAFDDDCLIMISKAGYGEQLFKLPMVKQMEVSLTRRDGAFTGRVMNSETEDPLGNVMIMATDRNSAKTHQVMSDERGRYALQLDPNGNYDIVYSKAGFLNSSRSVNVSGSNPDLGIQELELSPFFDPASVNVNPQPSSISTPSIGSPDDGSVKEEVIVSPPPPPPVVTTPVVKNYAPKGKRFEVQVGAFSTPKPGKFSDLADIGVVYPDKRGNLTVYKVGVFKSREEAEVAREEIVARGHSRAFVREVIKSNPVYDAIDNMSVKGGAYTPPPTAPVTTEVYTSQPYTPPPPPPTTTTTYSSPPPITTTAPSPPPRSTSGNVVFKVQLGAYSNPNAIGNFDTRLRNFGTIQQELRNNGLTVFLLGDYSSLTDANRARENARNLGVPSAFVVAYSDGKRVKLSDVIGD